MSDDGCADDVRDEFIFLAVPGEKRRAGTSSTIEFRECDGPIYGDLGFILQHTCRPQHAHDIDARLLAQSDEDFAGALTM